jgi:hypothetical protein
MFKFKRSIAGLIAAAALVAGLGAGGATTQVADAATSCSWQVPDYIRINQTNGWYIVTDHRQAGFKYRAGAFHSGGMALYGTLNLTRFDTSGTSPHVEFTITWDNGSAGVYDGTIDGRGFVSGTSRDRWNPNSAAGFNFADTIDCV